MCGQHDNLPPPPTTIPATHHRGSVGVLLPLPHTPPPPTCCSTWHTHAGWAHSCHANNTARGPAVYPRPTALPRRSVPQRRFDGCVDMPPRPPRATRHLPPRTLATRVLAWRLTCLRSTGRRWQRIPQPPAPHSPPLLAPCLPGTFRHRRSFAHCAHAPFGTSAWIVSIFLSQVGLCWFICLLLLCSSLFFWVPGFSVLTIYSV